MGITMNDFKNGYTLLGFVLISGQGSEDIFTLLKQGTFEYTFSLLTLDSAINLIICAEFDNNIEINSLREIIIIILIKHAECTNCYKKKYNTRKIEYHLWNTVYYILKRHDNIWAQRNCKHVYTGKCISIVNGVKWIYPVSSKDYSTRNTEPLHCDGNLVSWAWTCGISRWRKGESQLYVDKYKAGSQ